MNSNLQISDRGIALPQSPIRKLAPLATEAEDRGVKIYRLNIGQPDLPTPKKALDVLKNIDRITLEYSPSQGFLSLRKTMTEYYSRYDINLNPDEIIVTTGGSEALLFAFLSCLNPGDEIIMPEPAYANYMSFAITAGVKITPVVSTIEDGFRLPAIEDFEKLITERTKAILICNPNNPTGYVYTKDELLKLRDLVKKHNLYLFSDEVYREFIYSGTPYVSAMTLEGIEDNVVMVDSVSKRYSECGIRIGTLVTRNKEVRATVMKLCQARLSPPLVGQLIAEASVHGTEEYSKEVFDEYLKRRNCLVEGINNIPGCFTPMPMGAFYTVVSLPVEDAEEFCAWCLKSFSWKDEFTPEGYSGETIMMAPASGFYTNKESGRNQARVAYVLNIDSIKRALLVLEKALEAYKKTK